MLMKESQLRKIIREMLQEVDISRRSFLGSIGRGLTAAAALSFLPREAYADATIMSFPNWKKANSGNYDSIYSLTLERVKNISSSEEKHAKMLYNKYLRSEWKKYVFKKTFDNMIEKHIKNEESFDPETGKAFDAKIDQATDEANANYTKFTKYCAALENRTRTSQSIEDQDFFRREMERLDQDAEDLRKTRDVLKRSID